MKVQLKCKKKKCAVYGEGALTDQTYQKWCAKFHAGDFSLDTAPQSGTPVELDSVPVETLTDNDQCSTL